MKRGAPASSRQARELPARAGKMPAHLPAGCRRSCLLLLLLLAACRQDMYNRPEQRPLGKSVFFDDRSASRPLVADVVPRSAPELVVSSVARGREQFNIYCAPCHGVRGDGNGVIVQHGFPRPPDLAGEPTDDVLNAIANGKGDMYSYADRVTPADRLSIAMYIQTFRRR